MTDLSLLKPVLAQAALIFALLFWMACVRFKAWGTPDVVRGEPGTRPVWKGQAGHVSNAFHNQLEMPMLFFAVCAFALIANQADGVMVTLAWVYVAFRALQAIIHTTYNAIPHRFFAYLAGNVVLSAMWITLALRVL